MNNLPLQPLVWDSQNHARSAFHEYLIRKDGEARKNSKSQYDVVYGRLNTQQSYDVATGFATIDEAKQWAWNHYNEKMQPYVKPSPTWIDVKDRLPERKELLSDKDKCLVLTECGKVWTGFYNMHIKPDDWYLHGWTEKQGWHPFKIVAWMLASDLSKQGE